MDTEPLMGGAFVASSAAALSKSQIRTLQRILLATNGVVREEARLQQEDKEYVANQANRRPRHVYLIDGARGAGKTTVLLTLQALVEQIGRSTISPTSAHDVIRGLFRDPRKPKGPQGEERAERIFAPVAVQRSVRSNPICALRAIFPADVSSEESLIEAVLARVRRCVEDAAKQKTGQKEDIERDKDNLLRRLDNEVAASWRLSRPAGREAIQRDSFNVKHFLKISAHWDTQSQHRADIWREFVNELLDYVDAQVLTVFFDDTDTEPRENFELLQTIRIFLDHPRIVTVIAGNLRSIRRALVAHHRTSAAGSADPASARSDEELDRLVEEYLEKVLPTPNRHFIRKPEGPLGTAQKDSDGVVPKDKEPAKTILSAPFDKFCFQQLDRARMAYLKAKIRSARGPLTPPDKFTGSVTTNHNLTRRGTPMHDMEEYTTWWLLRHFYSDALAPRTMRQLVHMHLSVSAPADASGRDAASDPAAMASIGNNRRLAVVLFELSENARLIRQFADNDRNVLTWLHHQTVTSNWTGDRHFKINDERFYGGGFEFDYICFRVDLGIASPILNNPEEDVPSGLVPFPFLPTSDLSGQPLTRAYGSALGQRRYGVSKWIEHAALPLNCIYMFDLVSINQWVWRGLKSSQSPGDSPLWAPSEVHRLFDYGHTWRNAVLDDGDAFADVRSYWDLWLLESPRTTAREKIVRSALAERWHDADEAKRLAGVRRSLMRKAALNQRQAVSDYVRACVVPLAAAAQLRIETGRPNDFRKDRLAFWREKSFSEFLRSIRGPMGRVEQCLSFLHREGDTAPQGTGGGARQALVKAWDRLGGLLRERPAADDADENPMEGRLTPFAAILNDLLGAHLAIRIFENALATAIKNVELEDWAKASPEERDRFIKHRHVFLRFLERREAFSPSEPARLTTLEDVQTLLSQMGRMGVLPPQSHLDLAKMHDIVVNQEDGLEVGADFIKRGLKYFMTRVLMKADERKRLGEASKRSGSSFEAALNHDVIGYDVPIDIEEIPSDVCSLVDDLLSLSPDEVLKDKGIDIWRRMIDLCGENLLGITRREKAGTDNTKAAYWMCPEYFEFSYRGRGARAFLLFLYGFTPYMRALYEVDREAFLNAKHDGEPNTLDDWKNSGRPFMWAEVAGKMRNFVRRFGDVLRLSRLRLELHTFAYGDGSDMWKRNDELAGKIEAIEKANGAKVGEFERCGGVTFTLMPDFSHRSLGINLGAEGLLDFDGMIQRSFDSIGDFFHFVHAEVPDAHWPALPTRPQSPPKGSSKKKPKQPPA